MLYEPQHSLLPKNHGKAMVRIMRDEVAHSIRIRPMAVGDELAIHDIHSACLTRTLSSFYTPEQIVAWMKGRTPERYLKAAASGEKFLVAEASSKLVGFASWEDDELFALFVHPDFQGCGVGSLLFKACGEDAAACGSSIIRVKAANGAASFYIDKGFSSIGRGSTEKHGVQIEDTRMIFDAVPPEAS